jgi:hypothetical protein
MNGFAPSLRYGALTRAGLGRMVRRMTRSIRKSHFGRIIIR